MEDFLNNVKLRSKETRWDRIRKKQSKSAVNIKSETVKKFIAMDFVRDGHLKVLNGTVLGDGERLDPVLVMDMRHNSIIRHPKHQNGIKQNKDESDQIETISFRSHSQVIEEHYIENQLQKFRCELVRTRSKMLLRPKLAINLMNNEVLRQSLESCANSLMDFYKAPCDMLKKEVNFCKELFLAQKDQKEDILLANGTDLLEEGKASSQNSHELEELLESQLSNFVENSEIILEDEKEKVTENFQNENDRILEEFDSESRNEHKDSDNVENGGNSSRKLENRIVQFMEAVETITYSKEESILSYDSFDSESISTTDTVNTAIQNDNCETVQNDAIPTQNGHEGAVCDLRKESEHDNQPIKLKTEITTNKNSIPSDLLVITQIKPKGATMDIQKNGSSSSSSSESETDEQGDIIAELFAERFQRNEKLLQKYFLKWIHYTTVEKIEKENLLLSRQDRTQKMNAFLNKIRREKNHIKLHPVVTERSCDFQIQEKPQTSMVLTKKYKNKIKIQQDIIELQKLKLERQERIIMELKLSKLSEEAKLAKNDTKQELKSVIRTGDVKNRVKAKCLQLVANLRDAEDEEFARLQGKALLMPKFLMNMQQRALERSVKHEQARDRRLKQEAEKEAAKAAAEEAKRLEDEEAKQQRIEALKEKRKQEKMAKIIKERERQRWIENNKKVQQFYRESLLRNIGMEGFKRLIRMKRKNTKTAELFYRNLLKKKIFKSWNGHIKDIWARKKEKADEFWIRIQKRTIWRAWCIYVTGERSKYLVAVDWHDLKITEYTFNHWDRYTKLEKLIESTKTRQALSHYTWQLKWKVLDHWRRLQQILKLEKETEERRLRWRMKIWELLPDYAPNQCDDDL